MRALRTHYEDEAEFVRRVDEVQRPEGYRLVGAFEGERCVAVAGFREVNNLAWGHVVYVDDLSTHPTAAAAATGARCSSGARRRRPGSAATQLHLDSGVEANRLDAHRLYLNTGMRITSFHFAKPVRVIEAAERARPRGRARARGAGGRLHALRRRGRRRGGRGALHRLPAARGGAGADRRARRPATRPTCSGACAARVGADCCCSATSTRSSRTRSTARSTRDGDAPARLGDGRHEGRRGAGAGGDARAGGAPRALRRGGRAARQRRGVAHRPVRPHGALRGWDACLCFEAGRARRATATTR